MQIGISYTPDTSNTGVSAPRTKSDGIDKKIIAVNDIDRFEFDISVKDAVSGGIVLEQKFSEDIKLKLAITGEYGKSVGKAKKFATKDDKSPKEFKLSDLQSYNIGGELTINDLTYSACYGSLGKSLTTPEFHKTGRESYYYNAAIAYKCNSS